MKEIEVYKECDPEDQWCGNFVLNDHRNTNVVRVVFGRPMPRNSWRVGVWGNDGFGLVKDFSTLNGNTEEDADKCFFEVISLKIITQDILYSLGFETF